jgi:hypothetical protein
VRALVRSSVTWKAVIQPPTVMTIDAWELPITNSNDDEEECIVFHIYVFLAALRFKCYEYAYHRRARQRV